MKSIKGNLITGLAILAVIAAFSAPPVLAQQYIAERMLEEQLRQRSSQSMTSDGERRSMKSGKETNRENKGGPIEIDPRVTPEYWGIKTDTLI